MFNFWWMDKWSEQKMSTKTLKKTKRPPKSSKNNMFIFGLRSTSDDWLSDPSDERWLKCKKRPPKSSKNEMFIFWWSTRRLSEDCQKTSRRPLEDHQKTARRSPEDHQKTARRPPEGLLVVFWQSSNTMIQGNFYKRLHFYMDSCAISPTASLFVEYTEKKTSVFQIQLEFWVNMTLCFWLMYPPPPPRKVGFCLGCNFSNLFPPKWLRMTCNGQFHPICNFSNLFPPKWLRMTWNGQFCMAKIKYTLIQGNFYERLPFYMDSYALSPMASLLTWPKYAPLNISADYQQFCMKPSEQGLFFQAGWNESKGWYAMIKTYKNIIISVGYQWFYTKPSK